MPSTADFEELTGENFADMPRTFLHCSRDFLRTSKKENGEYKLHF